jgi:hypothetical protein
MYELEDINETQPLQTDDVVVDTPTEPPISSTKLVYAAGNTSIILEDYERAFSYFDKRDFDERCLSQDFIDECISRMKANSVGGMDLRLYLPVSKRHYDTERMITQRMKTHFREEYETSRKKLVRGRIVAYVLTVVGMLMLALSCLLQDTLTAQVPRMGAYVYDVVAWFVFWTAFDHAYYNWDGEWVLSEERKRANVAVTFCGFE